ncbi:hypothetical protein PG993_011051 [Apiospora rasikravindrae]|uniref:BTB domain-containing protein n=1 Tax=Apiospora rasikravindrae TaxID=990691 RepID=A0ABR1SEB7_9PEZI
MGYTPSPCPFLPKDPDTTAVDGDGDPLLKVGTTKCVEKRRGSTSDECDHSHVVALTFRVCSRSMARASPVWKKMLFGYFAESVLPKDGSDWMVTLPDDSPKVMLMVLGMVHARFDLMPRFELGSSLDQVFDITLVTDKYDMTHILKPWAPVWLETVIYSNSGSDEAFEGTGVEDWIVLGIALI